jgi:hypothetical protein
MTTCGQPREILLQKCGVNLLISVWTCNSQQNQLTRMNHARTMQAAHHICTCRLALTCPSTGAVDVKLGPADVRFEPTAARVLCALRCAVRLPRRPRERQTPLALKCAARSSAVGCCLAGEVSDVLCSHDVCSQLCRRVAATSRRRRWRSQRRSKMQRACCHESRRETCHATAANRATCHFRSALQTKCGCSGYTSAHMRGACSGHKCAC